ncbi:hypothetical protein PPYR_13597 [Photinus pyralis]|uniref:Uncharacterized protein n=1 Tax=Photinus pyralis TaxID=7054 RepID=A0A5N4A9I7_PHOPY|nr:hypothetical protein PPYR_13597 [Photinus pyralis]
MPFSFLWTLAARSPDAWQIVPPDQWSQVCESRGSPRHRNISPPPGVAPPASFGSDADLHTFREALARSPISRLPLSTDLCAFITGEIDRNGKRAPSPSDVPMSSPSHHKRPRYM